ncbi:hypothetical protein [uncultured Tenacibaculum sp.]|uniref:hypothetical protein n=1 Tax=uncultured Tenacibaculum sp. TaxID=174713 RepID=UPI002623CD06|nr:hypothetical protein [uncultured Tenacibaculum sp.]
MIKKISYFILFLITIILVVGYFRYTPQLVYANKIPASAETIVCVNIRSIEYDVVKEYIKHPSLYFRPKKKRSVKPVIKRVDTVKVQKPSKKKTKKVDFYKTISIPPQAFFYTNDQNFKGALVSSAFSIEDNEKLVAFFKQNAYVSTSFDSINVYEKKSHFFAIYEDKLILAYKFNDVKIPELVKEVFLDPSYLKEENELIQEIKKKKNDVTLVSSKKDYLAINIEQGNLNITGSLNDQFDLFLPHTSETPETLGIANVSTKINTKLLANKITRTQKEKFKKLTTLSVDSVMNKWNGAFTFNLASFEKRTDTIVTYEYDDDFNKVAKTTIEKTTIPDFVLSMTTDSLVYYLKEKEVVKKVKEEEVLTIIPFFKVLTAYEENEELSFYTNVTKMNNLQEGKKLFFSFNVERYLKESEGAYAFDNKYVALVKSVASTLDSNNKFEFTIQLKESSQNFIVQLFTASR